MTSLDAHEKLIQILADNTSEAISEKFASKKTFVEPEISVPINVLEATTFQQPVTSGATN
jgi:hypothetical protein